MKRHLLFFLALSLGAFAQSWSGQSTSNARVVPPYKFCVGQDNGQDDCVQQTGVNAAKWSGSLDFAWTSSTVAALPPAILSIGRTYRVTDGNSASDCMVGGGSTSNVCTSNGSIWSVLGGPGGGGITVNGGALITPPANFQNGTNTTVVQSGSNIQVNANSGSGCGSGSCVITNPTGSGGSQNIVQPPTTNLTVNSFNNIQYAATSMNWSQTFTGSTVLTGAAPATLTLTPMPAGIDGRDNVGYVWIQDSRDGATCYKTSACTYSEGVQMTGGGSGLPGASSGTITFVPIHTHNAGFTIGSGSSGIYETMASLRNNNSGSNGNAYIVTEPASAGNNGGTYYTYQVKAPISIPVNSLYWDGKGTVLECSTRDHCINDNSGYGPPVIAGLRMVSDLDINGWPIASVECDITNSSGFDPGLSGMTTITTTVSHGVIVGDIVDILRTDSTHFWGGSLSVNQGVTRVAGVTSTKVYYPDHNCNNGGVGYATTATPGYINILNAPILDNAGGTRISSISLNKPGSGNTLFAGHFNEGITILNDQASTIEYFAAGALTSNYQSYQASSCSTTNPYCGAELYYPGPFANAAVSWVKYGDLALNCGANGIVALNGNGFRISDSVVEGWAQVGISAGTKRGGYGEVAIENTYMEAGYCANPDTPYVGNSTGVLDYGSSLKWTSGEGPQGAVPIFAYDSAHDWSASNPWAAYTLLQPLVGNPSNYTYVTSVVCISGATEPPSWTNTTITDGTCSWVPTTVLTQTYNYYLLVNDPTYGESAPLFFGSATPSTSSLTIFFPRISGETYTILRQPVNITSTPTLENCLGGALTTSCGVVATGIPQCAVGSGLSGGLFCTYSDPLGSTTSAASLIPANPTYIPNPSFWPGAVVIAGGGQFTFDNQPLLAGAVSLAGNASPFATTPTLFSQCPIGYVQSLGGNVTLLDESNLFLNGMQGRIIIQRPYGFTLNNQHYLTLVNSDPLATAASSTWRVPYHALDTYLANDSNSVALNAASLAFGTPTAISNYIGKSPDGSSWLERLTANSKSLQVPLTVYGNTTVLGLGAGPAFPFQLSGTQVSNVLGSNTGWTAYSAGPGAACTVSGGFLGFTIGTDGFVYCSYTGASLPSNQYVIAKLAIWNPAGESALGLRMSNSADTGYVFGCQNSTSYLNYYVSGAGGSIATGPSCYQGDYLLFEVIGSSLTATDITQGFTLTGTDTHITAAGYAGLVGIDVGADSSQMSNFMAGSASYSSAAVVSAPSVTGVYEAGILNTDELIYTNKQALSTGAATHTFTNSFTFTSSATFGCTCTDQTAANACKAVPASATTVTLAGTSSDVLWLSCSGH